MGSIKAQLADSVAGIMSRSGLTPMAAAVPASTGNITSVVAVLEVTSVRKVSSKQVAAIRRIGLSPWT